MSKEDISVTQQNILHALVENSKYRKTGLSFREMQEVAEVSSTNTVSYNIEILKTEGLVKHEERTARSTFATKKGKDTIKPGPKQQKA